MVTVPSGPTNGPSDLATLWDQALAEFKDRTKMDLSKFHFNSMEEAIQSTHAQQQSFNTFRHDKGKVDAVRSALGRNLGLIQKIVSGVKMAADAAAVCPPAIPGTILMTAFTCVFQSFKDVSADYDRVLGFYTHMGSFLDRLSILEDKKPKLDPLDRCIRQVFASMLKLCGIAADYKEQKRLKKWIHTLTDGGGDPALRAAQASIDDAISQFDQAVSVTTLFTAVEIKESTSRVEERVDDLVHVTEETRYETKQMTSIITESVQQVDIKIDDMTENIQTLQRTVTDKFDMGMSSLSSKLDALLKQSPQHHIEGVPRDMQQKDQRGKADLGSKKHLALAEIRRHFSDVAETRKMIEAQRSELQYTSVKSTAAWVTGTAEYNAWIEGTKPVLWLCGGPGVGKSHLANFILQDLEEKNRLDSRNSVGYFFFDEEHDNLRKFRNALRSAVVQIAEKNPTYCETLAAEMSDDADEEPWKQFFASRYPQSSESRLYLLLDGVDEAHETDIQIIAELSKQIVSENLNIHILLTARPHLESSFSNPDLVKLEVGRNEITEDMKKLIRSRLQHLSRLKKLRGHTRKLIREILYKQADSMLYAELMLRRFNTIGRETKILKILENPLPASLEELYKSMLDDCQRGRSQAQCTILRSLFAFLAHSKRAITLEEASSLIKIIDHDATFDIEDEVIGKSSHILDLGRDVDDKDDNDENDDQHSDDMEGDNHDKKDFVVQLITQSGLAPLTFQDRPLRDYFREVKENDGGIRTPTSHAHLIIFELLLSILIAESDESRSDDQKCHWKLLQYAAKFWPHHFVEIKIDDLSDEEFIRTFNGLRSLLTGGKEVLKLLSRNWMPTYDELNKDLKFTEHLQEWFSHAQSSSHLELGEHSRAWIDHVKDNCRQIYLDLAHVHVATWFSVKGNYVPTGSYRLAKAAFIAAGGDLTSQEDTQELILQRCNYFPDIEKDGRAYRNIVSKLSFELCPRSTLLLRMICVVNASLKQSMSHDFFYYLRSRRSFSTTLERSLLETTKAIFYSSSLRNIFFMLISLLGRYTLAS
jgi:fungal STAND N-terminal Goodbye domain